ncbi:MAG: hypothetical protein MAG794_01423 [Gammaproteobacteria bacterium]|nr:hypothetical protein [Gammaproteobacteria bacterium]
MSHPNTLFPRRSVPDLSIETLDRGIWRLADRSPERFALLVFYRGLHCPICSKSLGDLEKRLAGFEDRGTEVIAISNDNEERARKSKQDWGLEKLNIGYGLSLDQAREWGLFVSSGIGMSSVGVEEPAMFSEPGLFLVRSDGTLYFSSVQTMPFARPHFADIVGALDIVISKNYPARGEVVDHTRQGV